MWWEKGGAPVSHTSRTATLETAGCRIRTHDHPSLGGVLEAVLFGAQDPDVWTGVREVLCEEVARRSPQYLVFDLRALECPVGSAFVGGLVAGAIEMKRHGKLGRTRILATGATARRLAAVLSLCKLDSVLGGIHPDLESALADRR